jgi:type VI secretion system secreted protein VgrG
MKYHQKVLSTCLLAIAALLGASQGFAAAVAPSLGKAQGFAVLGSSTVTSTGATALTGNLGVSPGTAITGFPPGIVTDGAMYAGDAVANEAHNDAVVAYNTLVFQTCDFTYAPVQEIGGLTLTPGVHCFPSSVQVTGALTLDAQGDANAVFIFKIGSTLTTASNSGIVMINGGQDSLVFWAVGSSATLGTDTVFKGNILAVASITLTTSAKVSGSALALNGAVTMDTNNVTVAPASAPAPVCK